MKAVLAALAILLLAIPAPAPVDPDKEVAFRWVDENAAAIRKVSLNIWNNAELALREFKSSRELAAYLEGNGFRVERGVAGLPTAFVATYGSGKPVIAIYGEFDALPGVSQKAEPVRAALVEGGAGRACGHNLFGTASATAAIAAKRAMEARGIPGTLRFYGTPAEESIGGKNYARGWPVR